MSSVASPFGLKPAWHPSGTIRQVQGTLQSGLTSDIFQYSPVGLNANGFIVPVAPSVDTAGQIVGAFMGVEFTGTDGRRRVGNRWEANTVGSEIVVYYTQDPWLEYEIQADETIDQADIGDTFQYSALTGNLVTGLSSVALTKSVPSAPATDPLRITGVNPAPDNFVGDNFTIVQVIINKHQFAPPKLVNPV